MNWKRNLVALTTHQRAQLEQLLLAEGESFNVFPLSAAQARRWFSVQRSAGTMHHIAGALHLDGELDIDVLARSVNLLVDRHEILRTTFHQIGGQARQAIMPSGSVHVPVPTSDLQSLAPAKQQDEVIRQAIEEREKPFDVEEGPLLRAVVLVLGPASHALLFTIHHLVADGWSMHIILNELGAYYCSLMTERAVELAPLPIQYADFALWQQQSMQEAIQQAAFQSWRERLMQADLLLNLPLKGIRPAQRTLHGSVYPLSLPVELVERLRKIAQEEQATLFMASLAVFQVFLHRYTGQQTFVIGTYTANRQRLELANLIGDCTNILPLLADFTNPTLSFRAFLRLVRAHVLEAQQFSALPVQQIWPDVDRGQHTFFPVMFNFFHTKMIASMEIPGIRQSPLSVPEDQTTMPFDLQFCLWSGSHEHTGYIEYATDIFTAEIIASFVRCFHTLLAHIVQEPERLLFTLPLFLQEEIEPRQKELSEDTILQCIAHLAREEPDAIAVCDARQRQWTRKQLDIYAVRVAGMLRARGVGREQIVQLSGSRSLELVAGVLGVLNVGAVCLLAEEDQSLLAEGEAVFSLSSDEIVSWLREDRSVNQDETVPDSCLDRHGEQPACILHAGAGSAGMLLLSHQELWDVLDSYRMACTMSSSDCSLQCASLTHPMALIEMLLPLFVGAPLCQISSEEIPQRELLCRLGVTFAFLPAPLLMGKSWTDPDCLRGLVVMGEPRPVPRTFQDSMQGSLIYAIDPCWPLALHSPRPGQVVFAQQRTALQVMVLDEQMMPVPPGVVGTLYVIADQKQHRTDLRVRMWQAGEIEYMGREGEYISLHGQSVWLEELARLLRTIEGVRDAIVVGTDARLVAYMILDEGVSCARVVVELRQCVTQALPAALRPAALVVVPEWPLSRNGSIERAALPLPGKTDELQYSLASQRGKRLSGIRQELFVKRLKGITRENNA